MKHLTVALVALPILLSAQAAQAQITTDVAKITCRQLLFDRIISPRSKSLALWLSGYYNGQRGTTAIDVASIDKNRDIVEDYCRLHQDVTVMDAVEKAIHGH